MKLVTLLTLAFLSVGAMAKSNFICELSKDVDAYNPNQHFEVIFTGDDLKFDYLEYNPMTDATFTDTSLYKTSGALAEGHSKVTGMMKYEVAGTNHYYGSLFVSPELKTGGKIMKNGKLGGVIMYLGEYHTYDMLFCY